MLHFHSTLLLATHILWNFFDTSIKMKNKKEHTNKSNSFSLNFMQFTFVKKHFMGFHIRNAQKSCFPFEDHKSLA